VPYFFELEKTSFFLITMTNTKILTPVYIVPETEAVFYSKFLIRVRNF